LGAGYGDDVQRVVELAVAAAVEPVLGCGKRASTAALRPPARAVAPPIPPQARRDDAPAVRQAEIYSP
jgi:hypothetical protein